MQGRRAGPMAGACEGAFEGFARVFDCGAGVRQVGCLRGPKFRPRAGPAPGGPELWGGPDGRGLVALRVGDANGLGRSGPGGAGLGVGGSSAAPEAPRRQARTGVDCRPLCRRGCCGAGLIKRTPARSRCATARLKYNL